MREAPDWKFIAGGVLLSVAGVGAIILLTLYPMHGRGLLLPVRVLAVASIFLGLSSITHARFRRIARGLFLAGMAVIIWFVAMVTFSKALSQCTRSSFAIGGLDSLLVCKGAFAVAASAAAYVVYWVVAGYMEAARPNPSIERTSSGKPGAASHVKRWASR